MSFSNTAARHFVPLLARIVLCLVFIPTGWGMVMTEKEFSGSDVTVLRELGVLEAPKDDAKPNTEADTARTVNVLAIALDTHKAPQPLIIAWVIALVALIGGGLILIGLFTRLWALGLAAIMGAAFALESVPAICAAHSVFTLSIATLTTAAASLGLGVLAIGLLFTGAGILSLDTAIFSHRHHSRHDPDEDEVDED